MPEMTMTRKELDEIIDAGNEVEQLRKAVRAIELAVDGLNTKGFTQKPETQKALDYIKSRCRDALEK